MNQIFYFPRFLKLFLQELNHFKKLYIGLAAGIFVLKLLLALATPSQNQNFFSPLAIIIIFSASYILYPRTNDRVRGISYAMTPVSGFEKLVSILLHCAIFIPLLCMVGYAIGVLFCNMLNFSRMSYFLFNSMEDFYTCISLQSIGLLGNLFFKRQKFLKTIGFVLLGFFVYVIILGAGIAYVVNDASVSLSEFPTLFSASNSVVVTKNSVIENAKEIISYIIFPAGAWITAFFKMREQEY